MKMVLLILAALCVPLALGYLGVLPGDGRSDRRGRHPFDRGLVVRSRARTWSARPIPGREPVRPRLPDGRPHHVRAERGDRASLGQVRPRLTRRADDQAGGRSATNRRMTRARRGPASRPGGRGPPRGSAARRCSPPRRWSRARCRRPRGRPSGRRCIRARSTSRPRDRRARPASGPRPGSRRSVRSARRRCLPRARPPPPRRRPGDASRSRGLQASVRSVKRGPSESAFGPISGLRPVRLMWSRITISVPGPKLGSRPPAALVRTTSRAPSCLNSRTGWMTRPGSLPSYRWKRPWSMTTVRPPKPPSSSRPACPGAVAAGQPGSSANGIATGSASSSASSPSPEPSTIPTSGTSDVRARTAATRAASLAGCSMGGIGRVGSMGVVGVMTGLRYASRSTVGAGASPARRKYRHRDADHVPSGGSGRVARGETSGPAWQ